MEEHNKRIEAVKKGIEEAKIQIIRVRKTLDRSREIVSKYTQQKGNVNEKDFNDGDSKYYFDVL
jgi:ribosomal protein S5